MYMSENKIALRQSYFIYEFFLHNSTISSSIIGSPNLSVISLIIRNFSHISSDVIGYIVGISYTINIQHLLSLVKLLNPRRIHRNVRL